MLPEAASTDSFFKKKWDEEQAIVKRIEDEFEGKKLFYPLRDSEVSGLPLLESVGETLYENRKDEIIVDEIEIDSSKGDFHIASSVTGDGKACCPFSPRSTERANLFFTGKGGVGKRYSLPAQPPYTWQKKDERHSS